MWLNREKRRVFYLCRRVNGKPRQFRVGTGLLAERLAAEVEARKANAEACTAWKTKVSAAEGSLDELYDGMEQLTAASLLAQVFHRHERG